MFKVKQLGKWLIYYTLKINIKTIIGTELSNTTFEDIMSFVTANTVEVAEVA